ncbi:MAG TPA: sulfur carrier protein ThiS [Streptosporangiaceae bacterium]|jgi:sulfur carrier protein
MTTTIEVTVNGQPRQVPPGTSVGELIAMVTSLPSGIAAAVNGEILPRSAWTATLVGDGDQVEVVTAVQGG